MSEKQREDARVEAADRHGEGAELAGGLEVGDAVFGSAAA